MTPAFQVLLGLCLLGLSYAAPQGRNVRWCVTSDAEETKCNGIATKCTVHEIHLICVKKSCTEDCQKAISNGEADAMSLDSAHVWEASLDPLNLKPIMTESHHFERDLDLADHSPCQKERRHQLRGGQPLRGAFVPECDEWGNYSPQQSHGSTGYSWCVNKDGEEIDGTKTPPGQQSHTCEDQKSTRCLRHRHSVLGEKKPKLGAFAPECDEKGDYVPSQCHGIGNCWCVYKTGEEIRGTRTAPFTLPVKCEHTEKPCLKQRHAQTMHDGEHPILGAFVPDCDEKGNYRRKQCHGSSGYCWCVNEDGQEIIGTKARSVPTCEDQKEEMPCLKERQKVLSGGHPSPGAFVPDCDETGNYNPKQCHGSIGSCWCATKDGEEIQGTRTGPGQSPPTCVVTDPATCHYAVAVVKKSSTLQFDQLKGKRSCHSAMGAAAGWTMPLDALIMKNFLLWEGPEEKSMEKAASEFFSASCAPGAKEESLCKQCAGHENNCKHGPEEPYYGDEGALRCLKDDHGDVAFVEDIVLSEQDSDSFELLCPDNTRKALSQYKKCNFGKVPRHAVVTRSTGDKIKDIIEYLLGAQSQKEECKLFSDTHGKDLMFEDTTTILIALPPGMDTFLFLGPELYNAIKILHGDHPPSHKEVRWCTLSRNEKLKCDDWSKVSGGAIKCTEPSSAEECIVKILKREADVATLPAEHIYAALKCGLAPAIEEYYNEDEPAPCKTRGAQFTDVGEPMAVAVVKKRDKDITWNNLKGKKSCHTGVGHQAGWVIPLNLINKQTKNCDLGSFFSQSCAPGSAIDSNLCELCIGDPENPTAETKCSLSDKEAYYGNAGAMRCLVEIGDVAFVGNTAIFENTDGKNPELWAKDLKSEDFELLCLDGSRAPVNDYKKCKIGGLPTRGVVSREENVNEVIKIILNQQILYGRTGFEKDIFQLFSSPYGQNILFRDDTQCLFDFDRFREIDIMEDYFGNSYHTKLYKENQCFSPSALASACTFHHR